MATPVSISSNVTGLAIAEEATLRFLPGENGNAGTPTWYALEPNTFSDFGADFKTVARETINSTRQRLFGTQTDEDAKGGFNMDLTQRNFTRQLQGFFFQDAFEKPGTNLFNSAAIVFTGVTIGPNVYAAAAGLGIFKVGHLVLAKNFGQSGNNGLKVLSVVAAGGLTTTTAGEVAEGAPPAVASIEVVGFRGAAGDLTLTVSGSNILLGSTALDFTTLALNVGEWVFLGGDAAANQFALNAPFYARISVIAAHTLTFDFTSLVLPVNDAGAGKLVDIYFSKFIANALTGANVKRRTYQIERQLGNDGVGIQSEILTGAVANTLSFNFATAAKLSLDVEYVGCDVLNRSGTTGIKAGTRVGLTGESAFNTTHNVYLSRLAVNDPTTLNPAALYAFVSDFKVDLNNNVTPNKAIGTFGAFDTSEGDFAVSATATAYFATVAAIAAIRNNSSVGLQTIVAQQNAGWVLDLPNLMLGGGGNKIVKDKPIDVDLTANAAKSIYGFTASMTFFEYLPTVAMPV